MVKNLPANVGDMGSVSGSERSLEKEMATHSSILAWEIPWTEEPVGYSLKSQTQQLNNNKNKWNDYQIQLAVFLK